MFSAGGDLQTVHVYLKESQRKGYEMAYLIHETSKLFQKLPFLSVALVNGKAIGGGAELTLATDFRVFVKNSGELKFVHANMGLIPTGGATRLSQIMGRNKALEILLSCKTVTAEEAVNLGICDKVISGGHDPLEQTLLWFESLIKHDSSVINSMKQSVTNYRNEDDFAKERSLFANLWA